MWQYFFNAQKGAKDSFKLINNFLNWYFSGLIEIIFPKDPILLRLEKMSSAKIIEICPCAEISNALFKYKNEIVEKIIFDIKNNENSVIRHKVAKIMVAEILKNKKELESKKIVIIPVTTTKRRARERGFSQTNLLAHDICNSMPSKFIYGGEKIFYIRKHKAQTEVSSKKARLKNVLGSMSVRNPDFFRGKNIFIIDDVYTTGATISEVIRVLEKCGAAEISWLTIAH